MAFEVKRFWEKAEVVAEGGGFAVSLDGRKLKTPLKRPLLVPGKRLAEEIAAEWQSVEGKVVLHRMPYTQFAHAALDQAVDERNEIIAKLALYGETDLLCYRAESPVELAQRQRESWDPFLAWSAEALDAPMVATCGIVHVAQPTASLSALQTQVQAYNGFALKALYDWVTISGSLILGLAVAKGQLNAQQAWDVSRLDEQWQEEQWGVDEEAQKLADSKRNTFLLVERALAMI